MDSDTYELFFFEKLNIPIIQYLLSLWTQELVIVEYIAPLFESP
jgi:hypothetical protein